MPWMEQAMPKREPDWDIQTLADALPAEVARVTKLSQQYAELRGVPGVNVEPAILLMNHALQEAAATSAAGDTVGMLQAYYALKDFEE